MDKWSKAGDGQDRLTRTYKDGSNREITRAKDGGIVVTDTSSSGKQVTGDGATGLFGSLSTATRVNTTSESGSGSSGCFLTSACVSVMNLPDDCFELELLRRFRDNFMLKLGSYRKDVTEYYAIAPVIVEMINRRSDSRQVWTKIYYELVLPSVDLIKSGNFSGAVAHYKEYTQALNKALNLKV